MKITALGGSPPEGVTTLEVPRDSLGFIFTHGEEKVCVQFVDTAMGGGAMPRMMLPEMSLTELTSLMTPSTSLASFGIPPSLPVPPDERDLPLAPGSDPPLEALMGLCLEIKEQPYDKTVMYTREMLKKLRKDKGMTQQEWSRKLAINQGDLAQVEHGRGFWSYPTFRKIEERLGIILDPDLLAKRRRYAKLDGAPHPRETLAARLAAARGEVFIEKTVEKATEEKEKVEKTGQFFKNLKQFRDYYTRIFGKDTSGYGAPSAIHHRTGVSSPTAWRFWNGTNSITEETRRKIEKGLKIRLDVGCLDNDEAWRKGFKP
jgi:transcriptional regulator with XRE-family HTH domain